MTSKQLRDLATRHQVYLERLKNGTSQSFNKVYDEIGKKARELLSGLEVDKLSDSTRFKVEQVVRQLEEASVSYGHGAIDELTTQLMDYADYAGKFEAASLDSVMKGKKAKRVASAKIFDEVLKRPVPATGELLEGMFEKLTTGEAKRLGSAVRMAYLNGETLAQATRRVVGTKVANYKDGALEISRQHGAAVVHTSLQHVSSVARFETYDVNDDLVIGYAWLSTLDGQTSPKCRSLDGQKFLNKASGPKPRPPIHINCRSTTEPVLDEAFDFLDEGATRSSMTGYVDAKQSYYDWLKTQPEDFQNAAIGPARAKLLRDGGMTMEEFAKLQLNKNFEPMTLVEMKRLEPSAFKKAGVLQPKDVEDLMSPAMFAPTPGSTTAKVWDIADALEKKLGRIPTGVEVTAEAINAGVKKAVAQSYYSGWKKDRMGRVTPDPVIVPPVVPPDPQPGFIIKTRLPGEALAKRFLNEQGIDDENDFESEEAFVLHRALSMDSDEVFVLENQATGKIIGAASYTRKKSTIKLEDIGSLRKGGGVRLLDKVLAVAEKEGLGIELVSLEDSEGFYRKFGFITDDNGNNFYAKPSDLATIRAKVNASLAKVVPPVKPPAVVVPPPVVITPPAGVKIPSRKGVTPGTAVAGVFDVADELLVKLGRLPTRAEVFELTRARGMSDNIVDSYMVRYRKAFKELDTTGTTTAVAGPTLVPKPVVTKVLSKDEQWKALKSKLDAAKAAATDPQGSKQKEIDQLNMERSKLSYSYPHDEFRKYMNHTTGWLDAFRMPSELRREYEEYHAKWRELTFKLGQLQGGSVFDQAKKMDEAMLAVLRYPEGQRGTLHVQRPKGKPLSPKTAKNLEDGIELSQQYVHPKFLAKVSGLKMAELPASGRAYFSPSLNSINLAPSDIPSTVMHELQHAIDNANSDINRKARTFLYERCKGERPQKLSALTGSRTYKDIETAYEDEFKKRGGHHYMGKIYIDTTEIMSMGIERLIKSPSEFEKNDPEYFEFIVRTLNDL